ncbi:MAG: YIP1 family protein, partial [Ignavibacteria bacterium]|nr:YIP1 family protein [Ignavibacteria bacterium]
SDYRGVYHSSDAGRLDNSLFGFGLVNEYRDKKKLSYFVVKSYFNNEKLPKISQGNYTDNTEVIFIFFGLGLIVSLVLLVNSRRRFREYSLRALTRTYNFFQDIRDERVFSIIQLALLSLITSTSLALIYEGALYFLKDKLYFEKFISIFDLYWLIEVLSFLAWNPFEGILLISLFLFATILIISSLIKFFNLFMRTKIFFSQAYTTTVWSMFPFVLSLPLGSICIKLFSFKDYSQISIGIIILFHLWSILRLLQGVSILYEMNKMKVIIYFAGFVILILAGITIYFEFTSYSIQYFNYFFLTNN